MKAEMFLEELLPGYARTFDIYRPYDMNGEEYPAYGYFFSHLEKYVLMREANLWSADSHEHIFFKTFEKELLPEEITRLHRTITDYVEPQLVRKGEKTMPENHMYTYITCVLISEQEIPRETVRAVRRFRFEKGYMMNVRGYSQGRLIAVDLKKGRLYYNYQGRKLRKHYRQVLKDFDRAQEHTPV
ncbi:MAG: hypothetical protein KH452_00145 [Clostridiales bacterium]|nr:hypothetical protein [Clostridiales bacterium]